MNLLTLLCVKRKPNQMASGAPTKINFLFNLFKKKKKKEKGKKEKRKRKPFRKKLGFVTLSLSVLFKSHFSSTRNKTLEGDKGCHVLVTT